MPAAENPGDYRRLRSDPAAWVPALREVGGRHGLGILDAPEPGHNPTYPTFLCKDLAIKFFGFLPDAVRAFEAEVAAHRLLARDPRIRAPEVLARGALGEGGSAWRYLVTRRVEGEPWWACELSPEDRREVVSQLGEQMGRVHRLPVGELPMGSLPGIEEVVAGARRSVLPAALLEEIPDFLGATPVGDAVFVHGDLVQSHVFVSRGGLAGVIDWGDAAPRDPHYEIAKLYFALLEGDRELLRVFLDGVDPEPAPDFPRRVLAQALYRQAEGLRQHLGFDTFHTLPTILAGRQVRSLGELAERLFGD